MRRQTVDGLQIGIGSFEEAAAVVRGRGGSNVPRDIISTAVEAFALFCLCDRFLCFLLCNQ